MWPTNLVVPGVHFCCISVFVCVLLLLCVIRSVVVLSMLRRGLTVPFTLTCRLRRLFLWRLLLCPLLFYFGLHGVWGGDA